MVTRVRRIALLFLFALVFGGGAVFGQEVAPTRPLKFKISLSKELSPTPVSGRLLVFMTDSPKDTQFIEAGFVPGEVWLAAMEVGRIAPGGSVELDPDRTAFPQPFSKAKAGKYKFMALLDPDHTYAYHGPDAGDLSSVVVTVEKVDPTNAAPVELVLSRKTPPRFVPKDTETVKLVEFQSPALTEFWGRPISFKAGVVLPPNYEKDSAKSYPTVFHVHGFGGDLSEAWRVAKSLGDSMTKDPKLEMIHVYLDGSFPTGHHEFADSVNNGPWGRALTTEYIPFLEKKFRMYGKPEGRFLTGHSSGGWSTLWLQVTYPDFFGGTWSTSPDPVDLRKFTGIDMTPGSTDNAYRTKDGKVKNLVRFGDKEIASTEEFARQEVVMGEYGGQFASFEWVWSPRGEDGRPLKAFDRETGELNPAVLEAWRKYDIRLILENNWTTLGPKLQGKVHVFCGSADTFHLEEAFLILKDFFKAKGSDAQLELVPGRSHFDLYKPYETFPDGLYLRIYREMADSFEKKTVKK